MGKISAIVQNRMDVTKSSYVIGLLTLFTITIIALGSPLLWLAEGGVEGANMKSFGDALWLCIMSITTIGFGDHYPVTIEGRIITGLIAFVGATLYCTLVGYVGGLVIAHTDKSVQNELLQEQNERIEEIGAYNEELNKFIRKTVVANMEHDSKAAEIDEKLNREILEKVNKILETSSAG